MIRHRQGNLLEELAEVLALAQQPHPIVLHGVNCQGKAGAGIALSLRQAYPKAFSTYFTACQGKRLQPGEILVYESEQLSLLHCATQEFYGRQGRARVEWVDSVFEKARLWLTDRPTAIMPRIGSGLGGLDWQQEVLPLLTKHFNGWPGQLTVYHLQ